MKKITMLIFLFNLLGVSFAQDMAVIETPIISTDEYNFLENKSLLSTDTDDKYSASFSAGYGQNHGGLGAKILYGGKKSNGDIGIFVGVGTFDSYIFTTGGIQWRSDYGWYTTLSYGDVATYEVSTYSYSSNGYSSYSNSTYSKEKVKGLTCIGGYRWNIDWQHRFFIDTGIGYFFGTSLDYDGFTFDASFGVRF